MKAIDNCKDFLEELRKGNKRIGVTERFYNWLKANIKETTTNNNLPPISPFYSIEVYIVKLKRFDRTKVPSEILYDVAMTIYDEDNDRGCAINEHLGDIYSYKDLEDYEEYIKEKEEKLIEKALIDLGLNVEDYYKEVK